MIWYNSGSDILEDSSANIRTRTLTKNGKSKVDQQPQSPQIMKFRYNLFY